MIVSVVKAATASPIRNAEYTIYGADCTADSGSNCPTNHSSDRASHAIAVVSTLLRAPHNALRVDEWPSQQCDRNSRKIKHRLRANQCGWLRGPIRGHLSARCSAQWPIGKGLCKRRCS
jgi:hypothetical protein